MLDKAQVCPEVSPICVPEKEKDFADKNINSLDSCGESRTWQTLESSSVNSKEVSSGSRLSRYHWILRTSTFRPGAGAAAPGSGLVAGSSHTARSWSGPDSGNSGLTAGDSPSVPDEPRPLSDPKLGRACLCTCACGSLCVLDPSINTTAVRTARLWSNFRFKFHLLGDCACKGENGVKEKNISQKRVTESEPNGLIPAGGETRIAITCDAKYVAGGCGRS